MIELTPRTCHAPDANQHPYPWRHTILQAAIDQAPCITFGQFRKVARPREWSLEWLVERCKPEIERPTDTIRRVLEGARVEGNWDDMADVMLPYRCLLASNDACTNTFSRRSRCARADAGRRRQA